MADLAEVGELPYAVERLLLEIAHDDLNFRPMGITEAQWVRARSARKAFYRPISFVPLPSDIDATEAPNTRAFAACWQDLVSEQLVEVGYLHDEAGNRLSPFGYTMTRRGIALLHALRAQEPQP